MNNYDFPLGADNKYAPWKQVDEPEIQPCCPKCGCDNLLNDTPEDKRGKGTANFICDNCSHFFSWYFF